jgi:hypothetical protein
VPSILNGLGGSVPTSPIGIKQPRPWMSTLWDNNQLLSQAQGLRHQQRLRPGEKWSKHQ